MSLRDVAEELEITINFGVEGVQKAATTEDLGDQCNAIADSYRALAICELLVDADVDAFQHHLVRSGQTRKHLLSTRRQEGNLTDPALRCSLVGPFLAALAAHHAQLAKEIAALSPQHWFRDDEYQDDYLYARFLHDLVQGVAPAAQLAETLDRFQVALEGGPSPRLPVCRALLALDQTAFDQAFDGLLKARLAEVKAAKQTFEGESAAFQAESRVFIEGLVLLELAQQRGLATSTEYLPLCPSMARLPATKPFDSGYFPGQPL